jgi:hypothetical protein
MKRRLRKKLRDRLTCYGMGEGIRTGRALIFVIDEVHAVRPHRAVVPGRLSVQVVGGHFACKRESDSTCTGAKGLATHGSIRSGVLTVITIRSNPRLVLADGISRALCFHKSGALRQ